MLMGKQPVSRFPIPSNRESGNPPPKRELENGRGGGGSDSRFPSDVTVRAALSDGILKGPGPGPLEIELQPEWTRNLK